MAGLAQEIPIKNYLSLLEKLLKVKILYHLLVLQCGINSPKVLRNAQVQGFLGIFFACAINHTRKLVCVCYSIVCVCYSIVLDPILRCLRVLNTAHANQFACVPASASVSHSPS